MARRAPRKDANSQEIVNALRGLGCTVFVLEPGAGGVPDLAIGYKGDTWLAEVKNGNAPFTPDQKRLFAEWRGNPILVLRSLEDVGFHFGGKA